MVLKKKIDKRVSRKKERMERKKTKGLARRQKKQTRNKQQPKRTERFRVPRLYSNLDSDE